MLAQRQARQHALEDAASLRAVDVTGFVKQKTEVAYMEMAAHLGEWKKQRGHYQGGGGIRGVSFKVPGLKGVRAYYGGLSPRTYVPRRRRVDDHGVGDRHHHEPANHLPWHQGDGVAVRQAGQRGRGRIEWLPGPSGHESPEAEPHPARGSRAVLGMPQRFA